MNPEQEIRRLEEEIRNLAARQVQDHRRLQVLFDELRELKSAYLIRESHTGSPGGAVVADSLQQSATGKTADTGMHQAAGTQYGLEQFIGLKLIHLAGIVVLLIGISIGVKYAIDQDLVSPMARILLAYAAALLLFILSYRLRLDYRFFSAILFSGSMAAAYFTSYAALAYYAMFTIPVAFSVMTALTAFTIIRSLYYNRIEIAVIGLVGAYGIPFLVSNNTGRIEMFFGYVLLINVAVVYLAFRKGWRVVSLLAAVITWFLFTGWLVIDYSADRHQLIAIAYLALFYLLFLTDAYRPWLYLRKTADGTGARIQGASDSVSSFGSPAVLLQNGLLLLALVLIFSRGNHPPLMETGLVLIVVAIQTVMVSYFPGSRTRFFRMLCAEVLCLLVLLIGLAWSGIVVTALWILLSVILFVTGVMLRQSWIRLCAVLLIGGTLLKLVTLDAVLFTAGQRILSYIAIGTLLLLGSFYYQRFNRMNGPGSGPPVG